MEARTERSVQQLGTHVREWRQLQRVTAQQVAERAGITRKTLYRLENGEPVRTDVLLAVCRALGIDKVLLDALDPWESDLGRMRAGNDLPQRVRHSRKAGR